MPGKKKKKFIDKKNAVTFNLVHRSQRDPLQACEEASQRVLVPLDQEKEDARKIEQQKFGIFFEDDYDYLQHLRDVNEINEVGPGVECGTGRRGDSQPLTNHKEIVKETTGIQLPSSVFGSEFETGVGLLNKAAPIPGPRLDWDPEIVAALDEDFDYDDPENMLEDDFIMKANADAGDKEDIGNDEDDIYSHRSIAFTGNFSDVEEDQEYLSSDDTGLDDGSMDRGFTFSEEETKSRFTNYSMSSSVIRRSQGLTLLDDRFEKIYEQYDDEKIGALDHEEIDGCVIPQSKVLNSMMEEFERQQLKTQLDDVNKQSLMAEESDLSGTEDIEEELVKMKIEKPQEKWDCESILSTYSTLHYHPRLIEEPKKPRQIRIDPKTGIPTDVLQGNGVTLKDISKSLNVKERADRTCTFRPKDETPTERKARKQAVKAERKERRVEKKATKIAFRQEHIKNEKQQINARRTDCVRMS